MNKKKSVTKFQLDFLPGVVVCAPIIGGLYAIDNNLGVSLLAVLFFYILILFFVKSLSDVIYKDIRFLVKVSVVSLATVIVPRLVIIIFDVPITILIANLLVIIGGGFLWFVFRLNYIEKKLNEVGWKVLNDHV